MSVFIEGTGFYRGAPRACGEKPTIGLEGSGPVGSWRWVSKTCAETDKDRGECGPGCSDLTAGDACSRPLGGAG